jgi:site-specific DNA recombinase
MDGAVGYARVSTDEQAQENNSLPLQKRKIANYCQNNEFKLLRTFEGRESARNMERKALQRAFDFCRENRSKVRHLIVSDLSRLARNVSDQGLIIVTLQQLSISVVSIDEPLTDNGALGIFVRNMLGSVNQLFSDSLSERTRTRMQAQVKEGRFLWKAPLGYFNRNKQLVLDPERAPLVRQAYELVASGRFATTKAVLQTLTALGLRSAKDQPLTKQTFQRLLTNPVYAGWIVTKALKVNGNFEPIVSQELFDKVQQKVNVKGMPHKQLNPDFPLRGIVRCIVCEKPLTAGWVQGRKQKYPRYWCWTPKCRGVSETRDILHRKFEGLLSMMEPTAEYLLQLPTIVAAQWKNHQERMEKEARQLSTRLTQQKALNQKAITAKLNGELSDEDFQLFKESLEAERTSIEQAQNRLKAERESLQQLLRGAERSAVDVLRAWQAGDVNQRQSLAKAFFPEGLFYGADLGFFEPRNFLIREMMQRWLTDMDKVGGPTRT